jgi:hypothetical protein
MESEALRKASLVALIVMDMVLKFNTFKSLPDWFNVFSEPVIPVMELVRSLRMPAKAVVEKRRWASSSFAI